MLLSKLAKAAEKYVIEISGDCKIGQITQDSRDRTQEGLFFCISGAHFDAHKFAEDAIRNGAVALVVTRKLTNFAVPQVLVSNDRAAMALMAAEFYGQPAKKLRIIGITGTKGKTTTTYFVKSILEAAGVKAGLIGTTGIMIGNQWLEGHLTTPDPIELHSILKKMVDAGVQVVCMEASAHAISMRRVEGVRFEVGCFTNLSQDHLDYFETMDKYFLAKQTFFTSGLVQNAAINADSEAGLQLIKELNIPFTKFGISENADVFARDIEITEEGVHFSLCLWDAESFPVQLKLMGMFNVYNALSAASICLMIGIVPQDIVQGLEQLQTVPGRAEVLDTNTPYKVLIDYSHSPDAMENILNSVRDFVHGKVIVVFGCGGDRDKVKRPLMGEIAGKLADYSILTSDNPRMEDPYLILSAIEKGIKTTQGVYEVIENRKDAIAKALSIAKSGDIVILAGKGDETYQEIKGVKRNFNEKQIVKELLK